jgi:hypothetical protein
VVADEKRMLRYLRKDDLRYNKGLLNPQQLSLRLSEKIIENNRQFRNIRTG